VIETLGDRDAVEFVGVLPLAPEVALEVTAGLPHGFEPTALALARIETEDERLEH
jgi:hypothetical protein